MILSSWEVIFTAQAKKAVKNYKKYMSEDAFDTFIFLVEELKVEGPVRHNWANYEKLGKDNYHCHIEKGRPTYVACWRVDKNKKIIEVYYAGTHEKAPY